MAKITLIGSGKTAHALGKALLAGRHEIIQVWSKTIANADHLAKLLNAASTDSLSEISADADVYVIAVKDDAIGEVAAQLNIENKIIAHTSGIKSKELLRSASTSYGIFYPFVSMTKETEPNFRSALFMIEGSDTDTAETLSNLAQSLSDKVIMVEEPQRQSLHLAAVFAHNFTNHMFTVAEKILADKGLSFDDLRPLIAAHIANVQQLSPSTLQTGPAIRHDSSTIDAHLALLGSNSEFKQLYLTLTDAIQQWHKPKQ